MPGKCSTGVRIHTEDGSVVTIANPLPVTAVSVGNYYESTATASFIEIDSTAIVELLAADPDRTKLLIQNIGDVNLPAWVGFAEVATTTALTTTMLTIPLYKGDILTDEDPGCIQTAVYAIGNTISALTLTVSEGVLD